MESKTILKKLGYESIEFSETKIVYIKYDDQNLDIPKYKRACSKYIFDLAEKNIQKRGRSERGNLTCPVIDIEEFKAIHQQMVELGWL